MKTLYIHGLDSSPRPDKMAILGELGLDAVALHIDYRTEKNTYARLREFATRHDIDFIIGSSLGGMFGYWLAEDLGVPALLFNPALHFGRFPLEIPKIYPTPGLRKFVVLGQHDQSVPPAETLKFCTNAQYPNDFRIVTCHWLAHEIDPATFREMALWALASLE